VRQRIAQVLSSVRLWLLTRLRGAFGDLRARNWRFGLSVAALLLVLLGSLAWRWTAISASLPYCRNVDEATWTQIAMRMEKTGNLNPERFNYPSLQVYTITAGFSLGLLRSAAAREGIAPRHLGSSAYPYYELPKAVIVPKLLYATLSVGALALLGLIAWNFKRDSRLLWLSPLTACLSANYLFFSWAYLNVDILGAFFACATVAFLIIEHKLDEAGARSLSRAAVAGILSGLTLGCKYNLFWIAAPCVLYAVLFTRRRLVSRLVVYVVCLLLAFLLTTPYALWDHSQFITHLAREARHYADGHRSFTVEKGWPALFAYLQHYREEFGIPLLLLAVLGFGSMLRTDWKWALILSSFPVLLLAYMCQQRAFITRNIISTFLFVSLCGSIGLLLVLDQARVWLLRFSYFNARPRLRFPVLGLIVLTLAATLPRSTLAEAYSLKVESRNRVITWLQARVPTDSPILVDDRLNMDVRPLEGAAYRVQTLPLPATKEGAARFREENPGATLIVTAIPSDFLTELLSRPAEVAHRASGTAPSTPYDSRDPNPALLVIRFPGTSVEPAAPPAEPAPRRRRRRRR